MKCLDCGSETGFEWPKDDIDGIMEMMYLGPVCGECAAKVSPFHQMMASVNSTRVQSYALRRKP